MNKIFNSMQKFFDRTTLRAIAVISLMSLFYPIFFNHIEFRHTLIGNLKSSLFIYAIPSCCSFLIIRLYEMRTQRKINLLFKFLGSWIMSCFLISNSFISPFILDITFFYFYNKSSLYQIFNSYSYDKIISSYFTIFSSVLIYSLPALISCYIIVYAINIVKTNYIYIRNINNLICKITSQITQGITTLRVSGVRFASMALAYSFLLILLPPQTLDPCLISLYSQFESIDTNHDGIIDQREFEIWHKNNQYMKDINFYEIDMDSNSKISFNEWQKFLKRKKMDSR